MPPRHEKREVLRGTWLMHLFPTFLRHPFLRTGPRGHHASTMLLALLTCTISENEMVLLSVVTEKGGIRTGGSPSAIFPVRMNGWDPVTSKA